MDKLITGLWSITFAHVISLWSEYLEPTQYGIPVGLLDLPICDNDKKTY